MTTMTAARLHQIGTPFQLDQVPLPDVGPRDVLVRVRACGVVPNLRNVIHHYAEWFPFFPLPELPAIFGLDPTGEIAAVGRDIVDFEVGQRVYVNPVRGCGSCARCTMGNLIGCDSWAFAGYFGSSATAADVLRRHPYGGLAEYQLAPVEAIVPIGDQVSFETASHFGYLGTSYAALRQGNAGPGTTVLLNGATGTLGTGAALLALAMGVPKILAVARDEKRLEHLASLDPQRIVTHSTNAGSTEEWVREQTAGRGADLVIEALSTDAPVSVTMQAYNSVRRGGRIVNIGGVNQTLDLNPVWFQATQATVSGSVWFTTAQGRELADLIASGVVDVSHFNYRCFPLTQVNDAVDVAYRDSNGGFNNVVVTVPE